MTINVTLSPPTAANNTNFTVRGDDFLGDLATFVSQANTSLTNINNQTALAQTAATQSSSAVTGINTAKSSIQATLTTLSNRYLGAKTTVPTTNNSGGALAYGNFYLHVNGQTRTLRMWFGTSWADMQSTYSKTYTDNLITQTSGWVSESYSAWIDIIGYNSFVGDRWLGVSSSAPTGVITGSFYFDTTVDNVLIYNGTSWQALSSADGVNLTGHTMTGHLQAEQVNTPTLVSTNINVDWYPPVPIILGEIQSNSYIKDSYYNMGGVYQGPSGFFITLNFEQYSTIRIESNGNGVIHATVPPAGTEVTLIIGGAGGTYGQSIYAGNNVIYPGTLSIQAPPLWNWTTHTFISDGTKLVLTNSTGPMAA